MTTATVRTQGRADLLIPAGCAGVLAALLVWLGPPGTDLAAHAYQRTLFIEHGFVLWNNFWYAGRYSFVNYSVLYYPLAAAIGIKVLAVLTVTVAVVAFSAVVRHEWELHSRWTIRTFAVADGRIHLWVGGGIVWDSEPEEEIEESWVKARPLLEAIGSLVRA